MATWTAEDGTVIYFETYGNDTAKETLLLLPGLLGSVQQQWRKFIQPLSTDFQVVLMDLRGHGRSENQASDLQINQMLQDVSGLLDYLQVETVHVSGYSLGGYLGLMLTIDQPRRVPTLLTHAMKFYWTPEAAARMGSHLDPDLMASRVPAYADQLVKEHGARRWRRLVRQAAALVHSLVKGGLNERMLSNVKTPVMVCVGDRDEMVPIAEAYRLSRALSNGQLLVLPGVSHPLKTVRTMPLLPAMVHFHQGKL